MNYYNFNLIGFYFFSFFCIILINSYFSILNRNKKLNDYKDYSEYYLMTIFIFLGASLLILSTSLIYIYLGMEILAFSMIVLINARVKSPLSSEAAIKYLLLASLSSGITLLGICFYYYLFGTIDLFEISQLYQWESLESSYLKILLLSNIFILIGIFFKLGAAPLHNWVPDVFDGTALPFLTIFTVISKYTYILLFTKLFYYLNLVSLNLNYLLLIFIFSSLFFGIFGALIQRRIKRFLGYSTITHVGYMLLPFLSGDLNHSVTSSIYYLFIYMCVMLQIISILILTFSITGSFILNKLNYIKFSSYYKGLSVLGFIWSISFLSLGGLPPFAGFWVKFQLIKCLILNNENIFYSFIVLLFTGLSLFYYLRFIIYSFFQPTLINSVFKTYYFLNLTKFISLNLYYVISFFTLLNLFFFLYSNDFYGFLYNISFYTLDKNYLIPL